MSQNNNVEFDLELELKPKIAERCKNLRKSHHHSQSIIGDKSTISKIENPKDTDDFITYNILCEYSNLYDVDCEYIIFGTDDDIYSSIYSFWIELLMLTTFRMFLVNGVEIQEPLDRLLRSFVEYNKQKYRFNKTNNEFMDFPTHTMSFSFMLTEKNLSTHPTFTRKNINWDTAVDILFICKILWLIAEKPIVDSYKKRVCTINDDFKYNDINLKFTNWIKKDLIDEIIPQIEHKLKNNKIFKLGYLSHYLLNNFIDEDLSESFQNTIPLKITSGSIDAISIPKIEDRNFLTSEEEFQKFLKDSTNFLNNSQKPENTYKNVTFELYESSSFCRETNINDIIDKLGNKDFIDTFEIQQIPGIFSNNSEILNKLQKRFNDNILDFINELSDIQNNLFSLTPSKEFEKIL